MPAPPTSPALLGVLLLIVLLALSQSFVYAAPLADGYEPRWEDPGAEHGNLTKRAPGPAAYPLSYIRQHGQNLILDVNEILQTGAIRSSVQSKTCLFYSHLGPASTAQAQILGWYTCNILENPSLKVDGVQMDPFSGQPARRGVTLINGGAKSSVFGTYYNLANSIDKCNVPEMRDQNGPISARSTWDARASAAFATQCTGVVYYFAPASDHPFAPDADLVWTGYELPALTSQGRVTAIVYVDPGRLFEVDEQTNTIDNPQLLWEPGDALFGPSQISSAYRYFLQGNLYDPATSGCLIDDSDSEGSGSD